MQIGNAPRRRSLLWFLKRNFFYLVQKSRPRFSDFNLSLILQGSNEISPKITPTFGHGFVWNAAGDYFAACPEIGVLPNLGSIRIRQE